MSNVAHMPAHKALNIDNFHDATVKVGMYKNAVTAFMHPYTLGSLETSIRKTGGAVSRGSTCEGLIPSDACLYYRDVKLVARGFWSKDDVTFCVDQAAGLKDAIARGALKIQDWQANVHGELVASKSLFRRADYADLVKYNAERQVADSLVKIEAAEVNDVTGELELSKTRKIINGRDMVKQDDGGFIPYQSWFTRTLSPLWGEVSKTVKKWHEAAKEHHADPDLYVARELFMMAGCYGRGRLAPILSAAHTVKHLIRELKLTSQSGDLLMDAADKLIDAVEAHEKAQLGTLTASVAATKESLADTAAAAQKAQSALNEHKVTVNAVGLAGSAAASGAALQKILDTPVKPSEAALKASEEMRKHIDRIKAAGRRQ